MNTLDRIFAKSTITDNCWLFEGAKTHFGHGKIWHNGKHLLVHRVVYEHFIEPPNELHVCHDCDTPNCFNPAHLFTGTQKDNIRDMHEKGRHSRGETHAAAIKAGWTPEKRAKRAEQTRDRMQAIKAEKASKAGVPVNWKCCPKCKQWKPLSGYYKNRARHDGVKPYCKLCS